MLDPQLLTLKPSPQHMLPTSFTSLGDVQFPASIVESPDSLPGPSPFNWNDFTYYDELNHSLGILNPTDDMQDQINQLLESVVPSGAVSAAPGSPNEMAPAGFPVPDESAQLFRIPKSTEVFIKGVHSAPPPAKQIEKKLDETAWAKFDEQVKQAAKVQL
jgi:hypothetical protein